MLRVVDTGGRMRSWVIGALLAMLASGCAYVNKSEYESYWDADGDGWPLDQDCDDSKPEVYPYAPDLRGDGCDADCGTTPDADGDDWPDAADCGPEDPTVHPCSAAETAGDGIDSDCDGSDGARTDTCPTQDPGFAESPTLAGCGDPQG